MLELKLKCFEDDHFKMVHKAKSFQILLRLIPENQNLSVTRLIQNTTANWEGNKKIGKFMPQYL